MSTLTLPIKQPFDPSAIEVEVKNVTIGVLIDMLKNDAIDLTPAFQRKQDLWNDEKKSRLVESILLGLPLPSFYRRIAAFVYFEEICYRPGTGVERT